MAGFHKSCRILGNVGLSIYILEEVQCFDMSWMAVEGRGVCLMENLKADFFVFSNV